MTLHVNEDGTMTYKGLPPATLAALDALPKPPAEAPTEKQVDANDAPEGYLAVPASGCRGCAFDGFRSCEGRRCSRGVRPDGVGVIFVEKRIAREAQRLPITGYQRRHRPSQRAQLRPAVGIPG